MDDDVTTAAVRWMEVSDGVGLTDSQSESSEVTASQHDTAVVLMLVCN